MADAHLHSSAHYLDFFLLLRRGAAAIHGDGVWVDRGEAWIASLLTLPHIQHDNGREVGGGSKREGWKGQRKRGTYYWTYENVIS